MLKITREEFKLNKHFEKFPEAAQVKFLKIDLLKGSRHTQILNLVLNGEAGSRNTELVHQGHLRDESNMNLVLPLASHATPHLTILLHHRTFWSHILHLISLY